MHPLRKLGWTVLLTSWLAGGCAPQEDAAAAPRKVAGAPAPAPEPEPDAPPAAAKKPAAAQELPQAWPWFPEEEDEFEGDGWSFWPLGGH